MSNIDIIRAWKDLDYRNSLSEAELAQLPENPAGPVELSDTDLSEVVGGTLMSKPCGTCYACTNITFNAYGINCCE
jgi:mersacidin/lichenicidin family type 2 lantibiotic